MAPIIGQSYIDKEYVIRALNTEQLNEILDDDSTTVISRLIFVETRDTGKVRAGIFPAFLEFAGFTKEGERYWQASVAQRIGGRYGLAVIRLYARDIGDKYRLWDRPPTKEILKRAGQLRAKSPEEEVARPSRMTARPKKKANRPKVVELKKDDIHDLSDLNEEDRKKIRDMFGMDLDKIPKEGQEVQTGSLEEPREESV